VHLKAVLGVAKLCAASSQELAVIKIADIFAADCIPKNRMKEIFKSGSVGGLAE